MASYRLSVSIISRSGGSGKKPVSAVGASAYRSGESLKDENQKRTFNYERRLKNVLHSEINLPVGASEKFRDKEFLWNLVEAKENTHNRKATAQLAREVTLSLPAELNLEQRVQLIREFVKENFNGQGMIAQVDHHDQKNGNGNFHAHVLLTMREIEGEGFGKKNRAWNDRKNLKVWRGKWADKQNDYLQENGFVARVDHRTLKEQGKTQVKTIHLGKHFYLKQQTDLKRAVSGEKEKFNVGKRWIGSSLEQRGEKDRQAHGQAVADITRSIQKRVEHIDRARERKAREREIQRKKQSPGRILGR